MTSHDDLGATRHLVVSQRLRQRRQVLGLTQKQVITRLGRLGVTSTNKALSSLEHGAGLDVAKLPELARALDCSVTWLLGLTDEPSRWEPDYVGAPRPDSVASRPRAAAEPALSVGTGRLRVDPHGVRVDPHVPVGPRTGADASPHWREPRPWILGPVLDER